MAIEMASVNSIGHIEDVVDSIIYDLHPSTMSGEMLAVALELRALRWALVGPPGDEDRDTIIDQLITVVESSTDHLSDQADEIAGAIDTLTETIEPPRARLPLWYRIYRHLRD